MNIEIIDYLIVILFIFAAGLIAVFELGKWRERRSWELVGNRLIDKKVKERLKQSGNVKIGKTVESLLPLSVEWPFSLDSPTVFIGNIFDYLVVEGLNENKIPTIYFVEVKTGTSQLNNREELFKKAVDERRIEYKIIRIEK